MVQNMIQNEKIKLLEAWHANLFAQLSIHEVMSNTCKKTKPWVFNSLKELVKKRLLCEETKGNINIYSLNIKNPLLFHMLQYIDAQASLGFSKSEIIEEAISRIPVKNYCLIVFGSYADNKHTKYSDLDICFLVDTKDMEKKIKPYINDVKMNHAVSIDEHYITFDDFVSMLLRDEENLGKQIFRKHRIFFNPDIYYRLILEAHKHGFRI